MPQLLFHTFKAPTASPTGRTNPSRCRPLVRPSTTALSEASPGTGGLDGGAPLKGLQELLQKPPKSGSSPANERRHNTTCAGMNAAATKAGTAGRDRGGPGESLGGLHLTKSRTQMDTTPPNGLPRGQLCGQHHSRRPPKRTVECSGAPGTRRRPKRKGVQMEILQSRHFRMVLEERRNRFPLGVVETSFLSHGLKTTLFRFLDTLNIPKPRNGGGGIRHQKMVLL